MRNAIQGNGLNANWLFSNASHNENLKYAIDRFHLAWNSSDCFESFSPLNNVWIDRPVTSLTTRKPGSDFDWLIV